jgi:hypothetical protein
MGVVVSQAAGGEAIDLGGCDGCALGCAVTCASGDEDRAVEARQVLIGSGAGVVLLSVGPGLVARNDLVLAVASLSVVLGALVAVLAALAVRAGRPAGDGRARLAFRLLPVAVLATAVTWVGAVIARLL